MIDESRQDQAALFALGLLGDGEAADFRAALARDRELQALVDGLTESAAALVLALPAAQAPPALLPRLLTELHAEKPPVALPPPSTVRPANWLPWALAAGFAVAAAGLYFRASALQTRVASSERQSMELRAENERLARDGGILGGRLAEIEQGNADLMKQVNAWQTRDALAEMTIKTLKSKVKNYEAVLAFTIWDTNRQQGLVHLANLPKLAVAKDYQLWVIDGKVPVSAGVLLVGQGGAASMRYTPDRTITSADQFAVSIEKSGGEKTSPKGPIILLSN